MRLQLIAVEAHQALPIDVPRNRRRLAEPRPALLVGHFLKQQKRQLLDIVPVRQPLIAQDVAVVPELLNELLGWFAMSRLGSDL